MDYGNPGKEYEKTRHNVGFRTIDEIAKKLDIEVKKNKFDALIGEGMFENEKIVLAKPQTFMNLSGVSVSQIIDFYKLEHDHLFVIYDDIDIALGQIRIRKSGSSGTHNGMRNIVQMLATQDFPRIRIGTDKPKFPIKLVDYVLMPFSKEEDEIVEKAICNASNAAIHMIQHGIDFAMNEFNHNKGGKDESDSN